MSVVGFYSPHPLQPLTYSLLQHFVSELNVLLTTTTDLVRTVLTAVKSTIKGFFRESTGLSVLQGIGSGMCSTTVPTNKRRHKKE